MIPQVARAAQSGESSAGVGAQLAANLQQVLSQQKAETKAKNPLPVEPQKPSTGKRRKSNPHKPPAVKGYKWAQNGAGFDCRQYIERDGKTVERFVGYLGKRHLAQMRKQAKSRDELRELVKAWIAAKLTGKGIG